MESQKQGYKYSDLTGRIIGCSMEVHKILGNGFQEVIYQRALEMEMNIQKIPFNREFEMPIIYKEERIRYTQGRLSCQRYYFCRIKSCY